MTDDADAEAPAPAPSRVRAPLGFAPRRVILLAAVVTAFHSTLFSILRQVLDGEPLTYLVLTPLWATIVTVGTQWRRRSGLDIHDRQTDWLVGGGLATFVAMLVYLLAPRLGTTAGLVRLDVLELILFGAFGSVMLFGTRATARHWAGAGFVFACAPLIYRFTGAALGGTPTDFAAINVTLSAAATGIGAPGRIRRRLLAAVLAAGFGGVGVVVLQSGPPALGQLLPAALAPAFALVVVGAGRPGTGGARRSRAPVAPTVKQPGVGIAAVALCAVGLGAFPQLVPDHLRPDRLVAVDYRDDVGLIPPDFWAPKDTTAQSWAPRYFGAGAQLRRTVYSSTLPQPAPEANPPSGPSDSAPHIAVVPQDTPAAAVVPQQVDVDVLTADELDPFNVFPALVCYQIRSLYVSSPPVPLGHGVTATMYSANGYAAYNPVQSEWLMLSWTWKVRTAHGEKFQRVAILTLDGEPQPRGIPNLADPRGNSTVLTTFTAILRGVAATASVPPGREAVGRLENFARDVVDNQSNFRPA